MTMGKIKNLAAKAKESAKFQTERDPDLWDRERDNWRAARAAKAAGKPLPPRK